LALILSLLNFNDINLVEEAVKQMKVNYPGYLLFIIVAIRSTTEEIFFRGFLVKRIGVLASSLIFGLSHIFYGSIAEVAGALILGLILAIAYERFGNLTPNIITHIVYNFFALTVLG